MSKLAKIASKLLDKGEVELAREVLALTAGLKSDFRKNSVYTSGSRNYKVTHEDDLIVLTEGDRIIRFPMKGRTAYSPGDIGMGARSNEIKVYGVEYSTDGGSTWKTYGDTQEYELREAIRRLS